MLTIAIYAFGAAFAAAAITILIEGPRGLRELKQRLATEPCAWPDIAPGDEGLAVTPLRPVGYACLSGREIEVVASEYVDPGQRIRVTDAHGRYICVRKA